MRRFLVSAALLLLTPVLVQAQTRPSPPSRSLLASPGYPGWSVDRRNGCWVWDDKPEAKDTVTWTGGCAPNGRATGHGTLEWRWGNHVSRYEGDMVEGKRSGHGIADSGGAHFDGDWKNDRANGHGAITWPNGDKYEGEFRDGEPSGHGVGVATDGTRYEGELANGKPNGRGVSTWVNGDRYDGGWKDGRPDGNGEAVIAGKSYRGTWTAGCYRDGGGTIALMRPVSECP